jgi:putative sterol carrier protein
MAMEQSGDVSHAQPPLGGTAPGLKGLHGRLRIDVGGKTIGVLTVDDGHVELINDQGPADAVATCATAEDLKHLVRGEVNPVVAGLQGRVQLQGDMQFAIKVVLGLRAGSPFVSHAS